jgi:hypothetical protein
VDAGRSLSPHEGSAAILRRLFILAALAVSILLPATAGAAQHHRNPCWRHACQHRVALKQQWREIRRLTPYQCSFGRSAIPCYIVLCESGGNWGARNASGAVGRYQLLGWGAPWPARTRAARLANHRIAARLWAGGRGASNWAQCL